MTKRFEFIAQKLHAMERCKVPMDKYAATSPEESNYWREMIYSHMDVIRTLVFDHFPSGSGFDNGTSLDFKDSTPQKLVFNTLFYHMNECGYYDGWTSHRVTVRPCLMHGFRLTVSGRDRNDIKAYIAEIFESALSAEIS